MPGLHKRGDGGAAGGGGNAADTRGEGADQVDRQDRRLAREGVEGQHRARQPQGQRRHDQDSPSVHGVAHRPADERPEDERNQLDQADRADLERGTGDRVHLEGDRHQGELTPEHPRQLAREENAEIAAPPQRVQVEEDPIRHRPIVRLQVNLNASQVLREAVPGKEARMTTTTGDGADLVPIDEVARRLGLRSSAIRYYEERGLVTPAARHAGRRWYGRGRDPTAGHHSVLAVIRAHEPRADRRHPGRAGGDAGLDPGRRGSHSRHCVSRSPACRPHVPSSSTRSSITVIRPPTVVRTTRR